MRTANHGTHAGSAASLLRDPDRHAPDRGGGHYSLEVRPRWMGVEKPLLVLFRCMPTTFYETVDPRRLGKLSSVTILDEGNFTPSHYGYFFEEPLLYYREEGPPLGVVFSEPGARIKLALERLSGEFHAWTRTNRQFLTLLRKQFLIWRTLSDEVREGYARQGQD